MPVAIRVFSRRVRDSLWFIPSVMLIGSIFLALGLIEVDSRIDGEWLSAYPRVFGLGAEGSRGMLTAIAGSMLTVVALTFAMTLNTMTQASGQFTPRIFRNFMNDRSNQFVLGYFISVFAFCLVVLRTVRGGGDELKFVPSLAVLTGLSLALGGTLCLIFFIHHVANSLQINTILATITDETIATVGRLFPEKIGRPSSKDPGIDLSAIDSQDWKKVPASESGYIQNVDAEGLLKFADKNDLLIRMERQIGHFVAKGSTILSKTSGKKTSHITQASDDRENDKSENIALDDFFVIHRNRTIEQDVGFGIRQIVDIALRALSPGINDTTTAIYCIDRLGEIVGEIANRKMPSKLQIGANGGFLLVRAPDFKSYVHVAFDQIRIAGKANIAILIQLFQTLAFVSEQTDNSDYQTILGEQMSLVSAFAEQTLGSEYEKQKFIEECS